MVIGYIAAAPAFAGAPYAPSNPSPTDGATDVGMAPITLSWTGGDPDLGDTVKYLIFLDGVKVAAVTETSWTIPLKKAFQLNLSPNTTHSWYVTAKDSAGLLARSPLWTFTTGTYPWVTGERFNMYLPLSRDNPACRYRPTYYALITGENLGAARGGVKLISQDTGAAMWIGSDSYCGKILSWSDNKIEIALLPAQAFGAKFPLNSVFKIRVKTAAGELSNPVWLYIESGGGGTTW
jgi:hypothetical protein